MLTTVCDLFYIPNLFFSFKILILIEQREHSTNSNNIPVIKLCAVIVCKQNVAVSTHASTGQRMVECRFRHDTADQHTCQSIVQGQLLFHAILPRSRWVYIALQWQKNKMSYFGLVAVPVLLLIAGIWIACSVLLLGGTYKVKYRDINSAVSVKSQLTNDLSFQRNHILFLPWLIFIVLLFPIKVTEIVLHASSYYTNVKLMVLVCCFLTIAIGMSNQVHHTQILFT